MDILFDTVKGFLVGLAASVPMGPIAILVIQKTLSKGHRAGFFTGLCASVVDTIFAIVAIFALALAQRLMDQYENIIYLVGGAILVIIGLSMALSNPFRRKRVADKKHSSFSSTDFLQAIAMGLSNPMAIFVIFALFAFVGITDETPRSWNIAPIILSVSAGTVFYWFVFSWALSRFREKIRLRTILWLSRVMGALVVMIGMGLIGNVLFEIFFKGETFGI